jgi:putative transposase
LPERKGLEIYAWVLMSNHLHMINGTGEGIILSDIMRDFKKFTSKEIIKAFTSENESRRDWMLNRFEFAGKNDNKVKNYKFWQDGYDETSISFIKFHEQKKNYIHLNPVKAGIVTESHHYLFSSALNYAGQNGLIDILFI